MSGQAILEPLTIQLATTTQTNASETFVNCVRSGQLSLMNSISPISDPERMICSC